MASLVENSSVSRESSINWVVLKQIPIIFNLLLFYFTVTQSSFCEEGIDSSIEPKPLWIVNMFLIPLKFDSMD